MGLVLLDALVRLLALLRQLHSGHRHGRGRLRGVGTAEGKEEKGWGGGGRVAPRVVVEHGRELGRRRRLGGRVAGTQLNTESGKPQGDNLKVTV